MVNSSQTTPSHYALRKGWAEHWYTSIYLDVAERGTFALWEGLYDHQRGHQVMRVNVLQHLLDLGLALLRVLGGKVRQSLHPEVRIKTTVWGAVCVCVCVSVRVSVSVCVCEWVCMCNYNENVGWHIHTMSWFANTTYSANYTLYMLTIRTDICNCPCWMLIHTHTNTHRSLSLVDYNKGYVSLTPYPCLLHVSITSSYSLCSI